MTKSTAMMRDFILDTSLIQLTTGHGKAKLEIMEHFAVIWTNSRRAESGA